MIRITSRKDGFRRCGVAHSREATDHPDNRFTADQLKILKEESMLVVVEVADEGKPQVLNVPKTIELVQAATSIEELDALAENETRKGVVDAITKRRTELEAPKE